MTTLVRQLSQRQAVTLLRQPYLWLIGTWLLAMICVPLAWWAWGDRVLPIASLVTISLQCSAVLLILGQAWGWRQTVRTFGVVAVLTYSAELIGSKTGFPFGVYAYTALLQPQAWGVPLVIPLAWMMMVAPAWGIAYALLGERLDSPMRRAGFALLSALALTAWDLFLDPQMVGWGFWEWAQPSGYFGIPWVNFAGWVLTALIVTAVVRPNKLPVKPLIVIYGIVWALQTGGLLVIWAQPGPALVGALAMGSLLGAALLRLRRIEAR
ncbi:MAG: carotenoid biosynthesis protein [Armatimonadetes bacterium]|nr:carotenoid biosynthesis protein [Anaerolineae bacterium]